jgi:hypothetical protein
MTEENDENLKISGVPAEIQTKHFEDTSLKFYRGTNFLECHDP